MKRLRPVNDRHAYRQLWRVVDGAVADCFAHHPDYLAAGRAKAARNSLNKRIVGSVLGFAEQSARGRSGASPAPDKQSVPVRGGLCGWLFQPVAVMRATIRAWGGGSVRTGLPSDGGGER